MRSIIDDRVTKINEKWVATCTNCKVEMYYSFKKSALEMVNRGNCNSCKTHYKNAKETLPIYKNLDGKWCKKCSGCEIEQAYTRKDHARTSYLSDWQCKTCVAKSKGFSNNRSVGNEQRMYNKFHKSSMDRALEWNLTLEEMFSTYNGKCSLTGWDIDINYNNCTASLDRIDNSKGYTIDNIQWVHCMVNMCKNKYHQDEFIKMCNDITKTYLL